MTPHASEAEALFPKLADASVVIGGIFGENCNGKKCVDDARTLIVALLSEVEALREECAALRGFAQDVMEDWWDGYLDGGTRQDLAAKHGLIVETNPIVPCGESCACTEYFNEGEQASCFKPTPLLTGQESTP